LNIRKIKASDGPFMLKLNEKLDSESDYMLFEPGERKLTEEEQKSIIEKFLGQRNALWLVAEEQGRLNGFCVVAARPQARVKHIGSVVIGVEKSCWSRGIGSALLIEAIDISSNIGITRLELNVRSDNQAAIHLDQKLGFAIEGTRKMPCLFPANTSMNFIWRKCDFYIFSALQVFSINSDCRGM